MVSFYDVLGVGKGVDLAELRSAFKRQALCLHPDKGGTKEGFQRVLLAFETLSDGASRARYDARLAAAAPDPRRRRRERKTPAPAPSSKAAPPAAEPERPAAKAEESGVAWLQRQGRRIAGPQQRRLKQLCRLLRSLSRERRRQVLAVHFRQGERLELESWMREGAVAPGQRPKRKLYPLVAAPQSDESLSSQEEQCCAEEQAAVLAALEDACDLAPLCDGDPLEDPGDLPDDDDEGQPKKAAGRSVVTRGICRRLHHGVTWYTAAVHLHRLTIMSQEVSDLSVALEFLVTMTGIKSMVAAAEGSFEERLRVAVPRALREHRATTKAMSLHFSIKMGTTWFLGGTFRPPTMSSLEQALKAWATLTPFVLSRGAYSHATITALLDHGHDDWLRLRAALLALMSEAGHCEATWAERLDARHLAAEPFRQRLAELWNRQVMAQEERQQRRLGRWEKAQKRLLRVEFKQRRVEALVLALLEKWRRAEAVAAVRRRRAAQRQRQLAQREKRRLLRRERLERRARWGWLRRRDLTMEELLRKQSPA